MKSVWNKFLLCSPILQVWNILLCPPIILLLCPPILLVLNIFCCAHLWYQCEKYFCCAHVSNRPKKAKNGEQPKTAAAGTEYSMPVWNIFSCAHLLCQSRNHLQAFSASCVPHSARISPTFSFTSVRLTYPDRNLARCGTTLFKGLVSRDGYLLTNPTV